MATGNGFCPGSQANCLRCQQVGDGRICAGTALLLGPQDTDAETALREALEAGGFAYRVQGPIFVLPEVRSQGAAVQHILSAQLTLRTQSSIRAAYAPDGAETTENVLTAFLFAEPLDRLLENMEHEWVRDALRDNWLFSVFHPIIAAETGEVFAYESLIRARHPETQAVLGAGAIIESCEKLHLQHQLDQKARRTAIHCAAALDLPNARFFINFLPNTIYDPRICLRTTMEAAQEVGIGMDRLVFEVVETEKIPEMKRLHRILDYYRDRGMQTAVDDMGAGFTSVEYLTALRPDYVKLDREVVVRAAQGREARREFESIVGLAHRLAIKVIAEGIETPQQMRVCQEAGVNYLQGFLFARPASPPQSVARDHFIAQTLAA